MNGSRLFIVDVEAAGPTPVTGTMTEFGVVDVETRKWFHGGLWAFTPDPVIPAIPVPTHEAPTWAQGHSQFDMNKGHGDSANSRREVLERLNAWLQELAGRARITLVSDNPSYDYMWMAGAYDAEGMKNPFGFSGRRIGDYHAGLVHKWGDSSSWKSLRDVGHSHRPHEDAQGNAGALRTLRKLEAQLQSSNPEHRAEAKKILKGLK